jgi:hypothetical protein
MRSLSNIIAGSGSGFGCRWESSPQRRVNVETSTLLSGMRDAWLQGPTKRMRVPRTQTDRSATDWLLPPKLTPAFSGSTRLRPLSVILSVDMCCRHCCCSTRFRSLLNNFQVTFNL